MPSTLNIPVKLIALYALFVVLSCLLVGLLPPLVNKPSCKEDNEKSEFKLVKKRSVNFKFKTCPDFDNIPIGIEPAWEYYRLPVDVIPRDYKIEIFISNFNQKNYYGYSTIIVDLTEPIDTFIIHKKLNQVKIVEVRDSNNNLIDISCDGEYPKNDYYVFKTQDYVQIASSPLTLKYNFSGPLDLYESGIYEFKYGFDNQKSMIITKFEPVDARKAFPCFDEPKLKSTFSLILHHPDNSIALSNTPNTTILSTSAKITTFDTTPRLPTYLIGFTIFDQNDLSYVSQMTASNIEIRLWARKELIDENYADFPLAISISILNRLGEILKDVDDALPPKIDILASPSYPTDSITHYGFLAIQEEKILIKPTTSSENDYQKVALLLAKQFSEFWFGNYVTFEWWNELWLQEALADYFKYLVLDEVFLDWNMYDQFITEELIQVLVDDSYPSSHPVYKDIKNPYEIEEYFDSVERSKTTAILRMIEQEISKEKFLRAIIIYLEANAFGTGSSSLFFSQIGNIRDWAASDFIDRWFKQSNYPLITFRMVTFNERLYLSAEQERALNLPTFDGEILYPSPYNWTWFVPLNCLFGNSTHTYSQKFNLDSRNLFELIGDGSEIYNWVHCNLKFSGYYALNYDYNNWYEIEDLLVNTLNRLEAIDRANLVHNLFVNAFTNRITYESVSDTLIYLINESDYLPWKTVSYHLGEMISLLEYKKSFYQVATYFDFLINKIENHIDLLKPSGLHLEEETVLDLSCRLQNFKCLNNATLIWNQYDISSLRPDSFINIPSFLKKIVYKYHIQNTYLVDEWDLIFSKLKDIRDYSDKMKFIEALSYTRLPWLLRKYFFDLEEDSINFFDKIKYLSKNNIGREIAWDFIRGNYKEILEEFGLEDVRIGQMLIDITSTFELNSLFDELLDFIIATPNGSGINARFRSLEKVSINVIWLNERENEIINAFGKPRKLFKK